LRRCRMIAPDNHAIPILSQHKHKVKK